MPDQKHTTPHVQTAARPSRWWFAAAAALLTCVIVVSSALAGAKATPFKVRSTLAGRKTLPHRIHWLGVPSIPASKIRKVEFLIDGRVRWVEHSAPYSYGFNGNYLVTSWLTPGVHHFSVRATATDGRRAFSASLAARVGPAADPPPELAGTWKRTLTQAQAGRQPSGTWILSVDKVGWTIKVPPGGANLIDVAYLSPGLLESRGGVWTKPHPADNPTEGNGWCDEPFQPVRYHWVVEGNTLTMTLAGPKRCDGESTIWAGAWSRG
jgi:hypothetical protein